MAKMRVWSTFPGILSMLFFAAGAAGGILSAIGFWLPSYQSPPSPDAETILLIFMIVAFAAALWFALTLIISFFGVPKALYIIFAFLTMACAAVPCVLLAVAFADLTGFTGAFLYIDLAWYQTVPLDFIGFWMGVGGGLLAFITGFFVPKEY